MTTKKSFEELEYRRKKRDQKRAIIKKEIAVRRSVPGHRSKHNITLPVLKLPPMPED